MTGWDYIGVDWDSGEWLAVGFSPDQGFSTSVYPTMKRLWDEVGHNAERLVVDVPIGLCGDPSNEAQPLAEDDPELSRRCDTLARAVLDSRRSSVFNPPCRAVVEEAIDRENGFQLKDDIYPLMNEKNRELTGKGLMQQGLNIAPGIAEVEALIRDDLDERTETILEGHPEVCFRAFADEPLEFSKRTAPGFAERLHLLQSLPEYEEDTFSNLATELGESGHTTGIDDLVDSLALVLTACGDDLQTLQEHPPTDAVGLPKQMLYRRDEPLDEAELGLA